FELKQPQDKLVVTPGQTLTLNCTTSKNVSNISGPVKWLKGWGPGNETIYDQTGSFPRVTRAVNESNTDFTIHIRDVRTEDAGTYYCVKFRKSVHGDELFLRGKGTVVYVHGEWGSRSSSWWKPALLGAVPGTAQPIPSHPIPSQWALLWVRGDREGAWGRSQERLPWTLPRRIPALLGHPAPCSLGTSLGIHLRSDPPSPVELNKTVNFGCHVEGFYPGDVTVTWLENGTEMKVENISQLEKPASGLFELRSLVEVQATEEKNGSVFTCRVVHDAQAPNESKTTLWIINPA
ncbi:SIRPG protein, partial [Psophia crepitans]|nr:SIRPG protein [Psophia crepitans]